ncbi:hypothetical protein DFJ58DRAFT_839219 [Suillus subalutaceus]|uniref:uncharacterized protein n=1 Tax=Suillus subalutaceus TaxID=48586 RepID=UPI001B86784F|nr:uncharacterized protein DFJ58DRAFT_839219 [Suillus subalutaceus]KAG1863256.1 hypothetical protein DFJ58DRAFT_839219 [Suillus subalutaceus]
MGKYFASQVTRLEAVIQRAKWGWGLQQLRLDLIWPPCRSPDFLPFKQMWANTDVSLSWLRLKSVVSVLGFFLSLGTLSMSIHLRLDLLTTLSANRKHLGSRKQFPISHVYFQTPAVFWCFMHIMTASYYDPKRGSGLTKEMLMDAWKDFTVPGNFVFQCLRQIL